MLFMLKRLLITAGGTGGHIFPALAIAKALQKQGVDVVWMGTRKGLESQIIPKQNIPIYYIPAKPLRGRWYRLFTAPFFIMIALYKSLQIIHRIKPDAVLGMGGFAAGPGCLAAWLLRKPFVIHEQNTVLGLTNRLLAPLATTILTGFPKVQHLNKPAHCVGIPVRNDILNLPSPTLRDTQRDNQQINILIIGGSQGASIFNRVLPEKLAQLPYPLTIHHQTGQRDCEQTRAIYEKTSLNATVTPFIEDMNTAYQTADLIICRAGASTIAEICAVGIAAILVPFPQAIYDHQTLNAKYLADAGAAIWLPESDFANQINVILDSLLKDKNQLLALANTAKSLQPTQTIERTIQLLHTLS